MASSFRSNSLRSPRLIVWSLGTFHTALFFLIIVILVYQTGRLGDILSSLNTLLGVAIYIALWLTTLFATWRVVRYIAPRTSENLSAFSFPLVKVLLRGAFWGAINGILCFVSGLIIVVGALLTSAVAERNLADAAALLIYAEYAAIIGVPAAIIVGALVGLLFAIIDSLLLGVSLRIFLAIGIESRERAVSMSQES